MRKRITLCGLALSGLLLFLAPGLSAPAMAQGEPPKNPPAAAEEAENSPSEDPNLPLMMVMVEHPGVKPLRKDDMLFMIRETLRDTIAQANRYRLIIYSPSQPQIKRAAREHTIAAADLVEPMKTETRQRLAQAVGAQYLLTFGGTRTGDNIQVNSALRQLAGPDLWTLAFSNQISIPIVVNRRRLKPTELAYMVVDSIAQRIGIPSHLIDNLAPPPKQIKEKPAKEKPKPQEQTTAPDGTKPDKAATTETPGEVEKKSAQTPTKKAEKKPPIDKPSDNSTKTNKRQETKAGRPEITPQPRREEITPFSTDNTPGRITTPPPANVAPAPSPNKQDNLALALRYRQSGDLANVITSLRRAINEKPRDIGLRRQLIQAYQDRKMPDAAHAEASRALLLMPDDPALYRLSGDTLLAKGETTAAMKMYREAIRLDPTDVVAQAALGDALLADNQFSEAMSIYEAAAKADPKSPLPHRRLARAYAGRASSDSTQYALSLAEIGKGRALTPSTETEAYLDDYIALMRLMGSRLTDLLDQAQNTYGAAITGKKSNAEIQRTVVDMKERATAAASYLDKVPPAIGQEITHAHYQQGAALLLQTLNLLRDFLVKNETSQEEAFRGAQVDARRAISTAAKRLGTAKAAPENPGKAPEPSGM